MKRVCLGILCALALGCNESSPPASGGKSPADRPATVTAQRPAATDQPVAANEPVDRDNTGVNVRDRDSTARTPIDQNENKTDLQITADIRKRVVATKLSVDAQNVKIITQDGKVTLRGPVKTDLEKQRIEEIAVAVAGENNVDNQVEVKND